MNSRKFNSTIYQNLLESSIIEDKNSSNISIEEEQLNNENSSSNKNIFSSFNINETNNSPNNLAHTNVYNTQKRPNIKFSLYSEERPFNIISQSHVTVFTSKKRKESKRKEKEESNIRITSHFSNDLNKKKNEKINSIEDENFDEKHITTNSLLNDIIKSFNTFNYTEYELKHYFDDNHLNLTQSTDPYIELKVLCTSENVDLRCVPTSYIIGENGLNCSMKNHNRDVTTIGRQQINQDMIRPNDIMLFPTDSSLSRSHLTVYHKLFFDEIKKYKIDVDTTMRLSKKSKFSNIPPQIWYGIIHFLKPRLCLEIQDQGTIYGSYVKINEISVFNLLINTYILLSDVKLDNLFPFFKADLMYDFDSNKNNSIPLLSNFVNGTLEQINSMNIHQVFQKIYHELKKTSIRQINKFLNNYLNKNFNNMLINPYGEYFCYQTLFSQANKTLKDNQFYLTSSISGLIVEKVGKFGEILQEIPLKYRDFQNLYQNSETFIPITFTILSIGKILQEQKLEPNSKVFTITYNFGLEIPGINTFRSHLDEPAIQLIETEGDPCGIMNHIRVIILVDTLFKQEESTETFSIGFQRGFIFGKNKHSSLYCPLIDCNIFIYYSIQAKCWAINEISNLVNNINERQDNIINDNYFGLYICTSDDKGNEDRFKQKKYCVKHGDKIKISDTVLEVKFHI